LTYHKPHPIWYDFFMENKGNENQGGAESPDGPHEDVITTHLNADFDALASMIAAKKLYPEATLVFPGSQERNLRNFFLPFNQLPF
jgi:hypothetical protein